MAAVLVDLKRRIQGDFSIVEQNDERIVFANRLCPFAEKVIGRPAMCMMTSNVFGGIAAAMDRRSDLVFVLAFLGSGAVAAWLAQRRGCRGAAESC